MAAKAKYKSVQVTVYLGDERYFTIRADEEPDNKDFANVSFKTRGSENADELKVLMETLDAIKEAYPKEASDGVTLRKPKA